MRHAVHVVYRKDEGWAVKTEGSARAVVIEDTKAEALKIATGIAKNQKTELIIHGKDNVIQDRESYGNDPCPPKDKKY